MKVLYEDGPEAVTIPAAGVTAQRGEPVDVPENTGKQLLEQGWIKAGNAGKKEKS